MANSSRPRTPRAAHNDAKPHGENLLSSVVVLLFTAVICIGIGILIGRYQPGVKETVAKNTPQVERLPGPEKTATNAAPKKSQSADRKPSVVTQGVQISPAPVVMPNESNAAASRPVTQREPNSQLLPAPPPRRKDEEEAEKNTTQVASTQPVAEPATVSAPETAEQGMPVSPAEDLDEPETVAAAPTSTTAAEQPEVAGPFTVQVASFDTQQNADKFKKTIEDKSDYTVQLYTTKGSKVVKACIGKYNDKDAALKARDELLRINDFKGCFVKAISEL